MSHRLTVTAAAATLLASTALYPLVASATWFWAGAGAIIVVALAGTAARLRPLPALAGLAAELIALLLYLNLVFAGPWSAGRLLPTKTSLYHLWSMAGKGVTGIDRFAPPVPPTHGVLLLTVTGIGCVAALTDLLAVRLRRPALAGLPLLALFCVPETTSSKPGAAGTTIVFALGVTGYLALLSAEGRERVRLWGRLVSAWQAGRPHSRLDTRQLAASGRRIGMAAVVLSLFIPVLLPGLEAHRLFGGHSILGDGGGSGSSTVALPNPVAVLNRQLRESTPQPVLTYTTPDQTPPYLQVYVLGQLSPTAWTMATPTEASTSQLSGRLPRAPGLSTSTPGPLLQETITLGKRLASGGGLSYLPVPYPAQSVSSLPGHWLVDRGTLTVLSAQDSIGGLRYQVTAKDPAPTPQQLRESQDPQAGLERFMLVPQQFEGLRKLAKRVTAGRTTAFGRAVALQQWFTTPGNFTYSLKVNPPSSANDLIGFLTKTKRGYCQQFAFAMAVLARLLGIPSRVAIGYTQGVPVGPSRWRVTTSDAHAWPELYFEGAGWLRFEPTPVGADGVGQATASAPGYSFAQQAGANASPQPTAAAPGAASAVPTNCPPGNPNCARPGGSRIRSLPQAGGGGTGAGQAGPVSLPVGWLVVALVVLVLIAPRSTRSLIRRRRWLRAGDDAGQAAAAWQELRDDLADHRIGTRPSESPRALSRRLSTGLGLTDAQRAALERIAQAEERASYASTPADPATLRSDVTIFRRALDRASGTSARWQARLLPPSVLASAASALQHALDVFGWLDRITFSSRHPAAAEGQAGWSHGSGTRPRRAR